MEEIMLATDVVLQAIIGPDPASVDGLIAEAQNREIQLTVLHSVLYCAVYSVRETDRINPHRLSELLKYSQIASDEPEYLGRHERGSWVPTSEEVEKWRKLALGED
jgi:hypothetical protein